ncbi:MAG: hypothetical protein ABSB42_19645 [Tepidisphaeraceae bacterium]|jgi:hypothetical protein
MRAACFIRVMRAAIFPGTKTIEPPRRKDAKMKYGNVAGFLRLILPWRLCVLAVQFLLWRRSWQTVMTAARYGGGAL